MNYDIIGDVHGRYDHLVDLLKKLGYREKYNGWSKSGHQAIFVGDLIDGPGQHVRTVNLVRKMVENNHAHCILGNHEFNAIAWATKNEDAPGTYLRAHDQNNRNQHEAFLSEVEGQTIHGELIQWFKTLPLWMDLGKIRVVHACWHEDAMDLLKKDSANPGHLQGDQWIRSTRKKDPVYDAVELLCKGPEVRLPDHYEILDRGGRSRKQIRIRWWVDDYQTYRKAALVPSPSMGSIPDIPMENRPDFKPYKGIPVFFGHYGLLGEPELFAHNLACVDFSYEERKLLTAYRWGGEDELINNNFIFIEPGKVEI